MGTERGGLDYVIVIRDQFTAAFRQFRTEAGKARAALESLRAAGADSTRGIASAAKDLASATAAASKASVAGTKAQTAEIKALKAELNRLKETAREQSRVERLGVKGVKEARAEERREAQKTSQAQQARTAEARAAARLEANAARQSAASAREAARLERLRTAELRRSRAEAGKFFRTFLGGDNAANRVAFTFRRLFGILAAFAVARIAATTFFQGIIGGAVRSNAALQQVEVGVSAILTSLGDVRGAFGEAGGAADQFAAAQSVARKQVALLRQDSLSTAATFQELADTFQVALAPGITAGLDVDQVRKFSVRISQAATALGVAQHQLSEEIRSLLSGTIRPQNTRIATALGITNADIARAKELGRLSQFLDDRFKAFEQSGKFALNTFSGLLGRLQDGFEQLTREAGLGFFTRLQTLLKDTFDRVTAIGPDGLIVVNPEARKVLEGIFTVLEDLTDRAAVFVRNLDFEKTVQSVRTAFASIRLVIEGVIGAVQGVSDALGTIVATARGFAEALGLGGISNDVRTIVRFIVRWFVLLTAISAIGTRLFVVYRGLGLVFTLLSRSSALLKANMAAIAVSQAAGAAASTVWAARMRAVAAAALKVAAIAALAARAVQAGAKAGGVDLNLRETISAIALSVRELASFGFANKSTQAGFAALDAANRARLGLDKGLEKDARLGREAEAAFAAFTQRVRDAGVVFSATRSEIDTLNKDVDDLTEASKKSSDQLEALRRAGDIAGTAADSLAGILVAQLTGERQLERLQTARLNVLTKETSASLALERISERISELPREEQDAIAAVVSIEKKLAEARSKRARIENELSLTVQEIVKATEEGDTAQAKSLESRIGDLKREDAVQRGIIDAIESRVIDVRRFSPKGQELLTQQLKAQSELAGAKKDEEVVDAAILDFQTKITAEAIKQADIAATRSLPARQAELATSLAELQALGLVTDAEIARQGNATLRLAQAQAELVLLRSRIALEQQARDDQRTALTEAVRLGQQSGAPTGGLRAELDALISQDAVLRRIAVLEEDRLRRAERLAELSVSGSLFQGLGEGARQFAEDFTSQFDAGVEIMRGTFNEFASFISSSIVDAFDPTKDFDIKERFAQFLQSIAQLIIQQLAQLAIAKAVLGLGLGFNEGGEVLGRAEGGDVPQSKARPRLARRIAPHADPRDTVPAVLTPGEFVHRTAAVRKYGLDFMEALNRGLVNPAQARALVGAGRRISALRANTRRGPGFAEGGLVNDVIAGAREASSATPDTRESGPQAAVVVANDQNMERLLGGGRAAFLRFVRDNSREIDTMLRANRR